MIYSKRRKNSGGGSKKRSNRKSNKQSLRGGSGFFDKLWRKINPTEGSYKDMDQHKLRKVIQSFIIDCRWALTGPTGSEYCHNLSDAKILGKKKVNELIAELKKTLPKN